MDGAQKKANSHLQIKADVVTGYSSANLSETGRSLWSDQFRPFYWNYLQLNCGCKMCQQSLTGFLLSWSRNQLPGIPPQMGWTGNKMQTSKIWVKWMPVKWIPLLVPGVVNKRMSTLEQMFVCSGRGNSHFNLLAQLISAAHLPGSKAKSIWAHSVLQHLGNHCWALQILPYVLEWHHLTWNVFTLWGV